MGVTGYALAGVTGRGSRILPSHVARLSTVALLGRLGYAMDSCPPGFCSITEAYEEFVSKLEPSARPGEIDLSDPELDEGAIVAVYDNAHDAEKRAEKVWADALASGLLTRWVNTNGRMEHRKVRELWQPSELGVPGLDSKLHNFTDTFRSDDRMIFIKKLELNQLIQSILNSGGHVKTSTSDNEVRTLIRNKLIEHGGSFSQEKGALFVRETFRDFPKKRAMALVKEATGISTPGPRGPRKKSCG
jgi:hypothetical protein